LRGGYGFWFAGSAGKPQSSWSAAPDTPFRDVSAVPDPEIGDATTSLLGNVTANYQPSCGISTPGMGDQWDEIGFVLSSQYRKAVLRRLAQSPAPPSTIASDTGINLSHVSRSLQRLREEGLVELLVPETRRKGRVYGITSHGEEVWEKIVSQGLD